MELSSSFSTDSVPFSLSAQKILNLLPDFREQTEQEDVTSSDSEFIHLHLEPGSASASETIAE